MEGARGQVEGALASSECVLSRCGITSVWPLLGTGECLPRRNPVRRRVSTFRFELYGFNCAKS